MIDASCIFGSIYFVINNIVPLYKAASTIAADILSISSSSTHIKHNAVSGHIPLSGFFDITI